MVAGCDNVGHREETAEHGVGEEAVGVVFVKPLGFVSVDVEADVAEAAGDEGFADGSGVNEAAARGVDEHGAGAHEGEAGTVDEGNGGGGRERAVEGAGRGR